MQNQHTTDLLNDLNNYDGDNFWQAVVESYDYDRQATEEADQSGMSNVIVMENGDVIRYRGNLQKWVMA